MKKRNLLYSMLALVSLSAVVLLVDKSSSNTDGVSNGQFEVYKDQGIDGAAEYYRLLKADPITGKIDPLRVAKAKKDVSAMPTYKGSTMKWEEMGPNNIAGRVRAILIDKNDNNTLYVGGVSGGLWKSTTAGQSWVKILLDENIAISSIIQTSNGDIFVGTGEGLSQPNFINTNSGMYGKGIYKSTDGTTFTLISATASYALVNRLAVDKNDNIYAATAVGLMKSTDGGNSWSKVLNGNFKDAKAAVNKDRVVVTQGATNTAGAKTYVSNNGGSFTQVPVPSSGIGRIEIGISPSNGDVIYAVLATTAGSFAGIQQSTDGGVSWSQVAIGGSPSFDLFGHNNQGWYDNVCMVSATNPDKVYVGGIDMWKGEKTASGSFSWTRLTQWDYPTTNPHYVHADQHIYLQMPGQDNTFLVGSDGGISKTTDGGANFHTLNKNLNITQFYALSCHPNGGVLGGAQDNGASIIDFLGNSKMEGRSLTGGDGGWTAASFLNQEALFTSSQLSSLNRSSDFGNTFQGPRGPKDGSASPPHPKGSPEFFDQQMIDDDVNTTGPFVSNLILWETTDFANSVDTIRIIADTTYAIGDTIVGKSVKNNRYPSYHKVTAPLATKDTIYVVDPVQSRFIFGAKNKIFWTAEALYFVNKTPTWYELAHVSGTVNKLRISKDGDHLFYTINNKLYRLSGLLTAVDSSSMDVAGSNFQITSTLVYDAPTFISSIVIDPADANRVGVTLGGYANNYAHVVFSSDATSASPTFNSIAGDLPALLPVYAGVIPVNNPKSMVIGTEEGMMITDDFTVGSPSWYSVNDGIDEKVPVFMLVQQRNQLPWRQTVTYDNGTPVYSVYPGIYNYGMIYAATHGRGFFKTSQYLGIPEKPVTAKVNKASLKLYPNPVADVATIEFQLNKVSNVNVRIYDLGGRMVKELNFAQRQSGLFKERIDVSDLSTGAYFMQMQAGTQTTMNKFIVQ